MALASNFSAVEVSGGLGVHGKAAPASQPAAIADVAAFTDPPSAAEMTALRTKVNSILAALRGAGIIAT